MPTRVKKDYTIDEDRIYLMGVSGGGLGSWLIGLRFPEQIAAIRPISTLSVVFREHRMAGGEIQRDSFVSVRRATGTLCWNAYQSLRNTFRYASNVFEDGDLPTSVFPETTEVWIHPAAA